MSFYYESSNKNHAHCARILLTFLTIKYNKKILNSLFHYALCKNITIGFKIKCMISMFFGIRYYYKEWFWNNLSFVKRWKKLKIF